MVSHAPPRKPQLQLDPNPLPTPLSKRPRADEDHEASFPKTKTKTRRSDECGPHLSDIVPPNAPRLASAPAPMNGDSSTPGPPMDFTPPGPHMGPFPVEKNQAAIRPSDTQKINQVPINTSHYTPTSKCSNTSAALTDEKSAASNMQGKSEAHGPPPIRTAYGEPSEPSVGLQNDRVSKAQAQPSVHTTALALSTSSTSSDEFTRWSCTPYQLIQVEGNKWCPRVTVSSNNELCPILGAGHHPIATAIAKIHQYGHENPVPHEAHQVLKMFDDIHVWHRDSHHVTLLDPALYDPNSHSQAQLEVFRKKEWGWLVRAGRPITFPGILCGEWHFVTIQANYEMLDIALVLSRGDHLVIFIPGHDYAHPPQTFQPIQVRSLLHLCSEIIDLFPSCIETLRTTLGPLYLK